MTETVEINTVRDYLEMMSKFRRDHMKPMRGYHYHGTEDFVLQEGRQFAYKPKPKGVRWGEERQCFVNAHHLADDVNYFYVEGYATGIIPTAHAWCVDRDGNVVDNTWKPRLVGEDRDYYGVQMPLKYVNLALLKKGTYGVIDDWENDFPILKTKWQEEQK